MPFEAGAVVRVPFPYVERDATKSRPALVITSALMAPRDLMWVLMITNAARERWPDDVSISDLELAGLPIASVIRTAKVSTVEARASTQIGKVGEDVLAAVRQQLGQRLGL